MPDWRDYDAMAAACAPAGGLVQTPIAKTTLTSTGTTLTLSSLTLQPNTHYRLVILFISNASSVVNYYWTINGDSTTTNYSMLGIFLNVTSGQFSYNKASQNFFNDNNGEADSLVMICDLYLTNEGNVILCGTEFGYVTGYEFGTMFFLYKPSSPLSSVTSISVYAGSTNTLAANSYMAVYQVDK
ncbi:MAG TPA: hypothetical protein VK536_01595 [Candidatus Limnocylindrales bacterium]|nr:hypothetical protein [Candidatus Limnocylindrales bacterium]